MPPKARRTAYASLRFVAPDLDPSEVTRRLALPPDVALRRGDLRISRTARGTVAVYSPHTTGVWAMCSRDWVDGSRLETHIAWILDQIDPKREEVARLLRDGVEGDIFCYCHAREGPEVPKAVRTRVEELGLAIQVDRYELETDRDDVGPS